MVNRYDGVSRTVLEKMINRLEWERKHTTQYWYSGGSHGPDILLEAPCDDDVQWVLHTEDDGEHRFDTRGEALAKFRWLIEEMEET
jgi:hypothetical protein